MTGLKGGDTGGIPDKLNAAHTQPTSTAPANATFGKEFNVNEYSGEILKTLDDRDEMDFVQLEDAKDKNDDKDGKGSAEVIQVLKGLNDVDKDNADVDDDDEEMQDASSNAASLKGISRQQLSEADDFFEED
eukprot:CAMPEP_0116556112 /NCGR_PEP_ID=MMETSP0397-20121206/8514_1 /TAXON_ID=216820 /ORGANISM="Cyclophora tenuis, Strain ECT3854" /LENGTH=131 /DNA_ID=CAMNT_0004081443 /DNA_START=406 /DNA_END=805 /DNA_ORIENTATION=-